MQYMNSSLPTGRNLFIYIESKMYRPSFVGMLQHGIVESGPELTRCPPCTCFVPLKHRLVSASDYFTKVVSPTGIVEGAFKQDAR